jgi:ABC-type nitrate/sulfonate/bicarbonate transport system ATPase subunit
MPTLTLHRLTKTYREEGQIVPALSDINLSAAPGEFVSLIGPSGCGKSTLFNLIVGLEEPDSGEIRLDGRAIAHRAGRFGYMPQRDLLLPWRTILTNVILGPELAGEDLKKARQEAIDLLPLFGLAGFEQAYPATLSGGMRQRAALLRTFLCHRDIMLLDEPFGALDALTRQELQGWLLGIWQRFHKTILFITHDVEEALFLADRVVVLSPRPGRVVLDWPVKLPRPRTKASLLAPEIIPGKAKLLAALSAQPRKPHRKTMTAAGNERKISAYSIKQVREGCYYRHRMNRRRAAPPVNAFNTKSWVGMKWIN